MINQDRKKPKNSRGARDKEILAKKEAEREIKAK